MQIAQINNPVPMHYKAAFPNISFPAGGPTDEFLAEKGYAKVSVFKDHDRATQKLVGAAPYYEAPWVYTVVVEAKTAEEMAAEAAAKVKALQDSIVNAVQKRLDDFARAKNYDGILSAATYATSTNAVFQAEGQRAVQLRDDTWQALYNILGQVATQGRVVTSFEDIEGDLPVLSWT